MIIHKQVSLFIITLSIGLCFPMLAWGATTPSLGAATTYGVLSSTYTNTTTTTINGDVGFTTPPAVAPLGTHVYYGSSTPYSTAGTDQGIALSALNAQGCDFNFGVATDLSLLPQPLASGVYCIAAATSVGTAGITLSGSGTYIFRIDGALNTDANAEVSLINGASACNIFWTPTSATTLAANTVFKGTVIGDAGITVGANSSWDGRALSFGGTVTTDTTVINNVCGAGGSETSLVMDICPDGDDSGDVYDGVCISPMTETEAEPEQGANGEDTSMPTSTIISPDNSTMVPFAFGVPSTQDDTLHGGIILPAQLPNSGATGAESNHLLKIITGVSVLLSIFYAIGIRFKNRVR